MSIYIFKYYNVCPNNICSQYCQYLYIIKKKKASKADGTVNYSLKKIFPWFIIGFLLASLLNTLGIFSESIVEFLSATGKFMIVMALSAVGLSANFKDMLKTGVKPLLLGLILWFVVSVVSILVQLSTGQI